MTGVGVGCFIATGREKTRPCGFGHETLLLPPNCGPMMEHPGLTRRE